MISVFIIVFRLFAQRGLQWIGQSENAVVTVRPKKISIHVKAGRGKNIAKLLRQIWTGEKRLHSV